MDELAPRLDESPDTWVQRITPLLRREFQSSADPAARLGMAQILSRVLNVPTSSAFMFLSAAQEPNTAEYLLGTHED